MAERGEWPGGGLFLGALSLSPPFNKTLLVLKFFLSPFQKVFPPSPLSPAFFFFFTPLLCFFSFFPFSRLLPPLFSGPAFFFFFRVFLSLLPPCPQRSWALFIEAKGAVFLQLSRGAAGWSAIGRGCRGSVGGARWVVGHCVRSVGSRRESGRQKFKKKLHFSFLLPRCMFGGEEER
jgi:hypothetical protein